MLVKDCKYLAKRIMLRLRPHLIKNKHTCSYNRVEFISSQHHHKLVSGSWKRMRSRVYAPGVYESTGTSAGATILGEEFVECRAIIPVYSSLFLAPRSSFYVFCLLR